MMGKPPAGASTRPVDTSQHALIGVCTGFAAAVISTIAVLGLPPWPEMTERVMTAIAEARIAESGLESIVWQGFWCEIG
ncbi:hypothetical protein [Rhodococcus wratislaviensis]|uniref:Uncharacterized protein n=1 Tax=Rhodococcus wratislaviensis NBRC 100605 TaxID=1219028 RepID=X0Q364_RHOWR|nr:hypothetical protein RW1_022_00440 [Rhodococcus wratislaviensis NBRC 100605]